MTSTPNDSRPFRSAMRWCWRSFRRLPKILQACVVAGSLGGIVMGVFVGDMGLALMGTAVGLSGIAIGVAAGLAAVVLPWMAKHTFMSKRSGR